jgi:hypothetical protein
MKKCFEANKSKRISKKSVLKGKIQSKYDNENYFKILIPQRDTRKFPAMQWTRQNTFLISWDYPSNS